MIHILSPEVYNRIAAGEVVDRPYSVVKELVENALDAGASEITIEIECGGKKSIRVTDNGCGIEKSDLKAAFYPHATSKLQSAEDLEGIATLGFRGEAIASIAAVSKMSITSKTKDGAAWSLTSNGGVLGEIVPAAGADGTCVEVDDLFYHTPARLKFLKTDTQEEGDVGNMVARFILSRPFVAFTYLVNGKVRYRSFGDGLDSAAAVVYGTDTLENCYEVNAEKHGLRLRGYLGNQNYFKPNRSYQNFFVNGRSVCNQTLSLAVANAYSNYLMKRQYPFYVLFLDVPPKIVDVNVHPNKADVRFADNQVIYGCVYSIVSAVLDGNSRALEYLAKTPKIRETGLEEADCSKDLPQTAESGATARAASWANVPAESRAASPKERRVTAQAASGANVTAESGDTAPKERRVSAPAESGATAPKERRVTAPVESRIAASAESGTTAQAASWANVTAESGNAAPTKGKMSYEEAKRELRFEIPPLGKDRPYFGREEKTPELRSPIGNFKNQPGREEEKDFFEENRRTLLERSQKAQQEKIDPSALSFQGELFRTYLIYETGDEAYLVDQHAAHERLLFNKLNERLERREPVSQPMLMPYIKSLNPQEFAFLVKNFPILRSFGFEIEEFGVSSVKISAVPVDLYGMDLEGFLSELLSSMETLRAVKLEDLVRNRLATMACKAAVKGGEKLTEQEVRALICDMEGDMGLKCPHGRPACVKLKKSELEKLFKRTI